MPRRGLSPAQTGTLQVTPVTKDSNAVRPKTPTLHVTRRLIGTPTVTLLCFANTARARSLKHTSAQPLLVFGGALALVIADSQIILGVCIACLGLLEIPLNTLCVVSGLRVILRRAWCVSVCAHASSVMARRRRASSLLPVRTHARTRARRRQARTAARCSCTQQGKGARPSSQQ